MMHLSFFRVGRFWAVDLVIWRLTTRIGTWQVGMWWRREGDHLTLFNSWRAKRR